MVDMCSCCKLIKEINEYQSKYVDTVARVSIIDTSYLKGKIKTSKNKTGEITFSSFVPSYCPECGNKL